jgi:hypothetical protein
MKNKIYMTTAGLLAIILVSSLVSAFGTSYIFGRPLKLYPGETKDIYVTLQNNGGSEDITAKADITQDLEIAKITDNTDTFFVPYRVPVQVNLSFTVPENAKIGETYRVKLRFIPQTSEEQGMGLVFATGSNIDVLVVEKPQPETGELEESSSPFMLLLFIGLIIVIMAAILIILVRKKFKK